LKAVSGLLLMRLGRLSLVAVICAAVALPGRGGALRPAPAGSR